MSYDNPSEERSIERKRGRRASILMKYTKDIHNCATCRTLRRVAIVGKFQSSCSLTDTHVRNHCCDISPSGVTLLFSRRELL